MSTGVWHKPLQFDSGETVVMHNPSVMVHYHPSSQPDEWGNVQVSMQSMWKTINSLHCYMLTS